MYLSKLSKKKQSSMRSCMICISTFRFSSVEMDGGHQANCMMCTACLSHERWAVNTSVVNFWLHEIIPPGRSSPSVLCFWAVPLEECKVD